MPTVTHTLYTEEGDELEVVFPAKFEVCHRCRGNGKHVNPAIDGNGLSQEDFDQDPDFREDYFSGVYDVPCYECKGQRVIAEIDEERLSAEQKAQLVLLEAQWDEDAATDHMQEMERRMGA